MALDLLELGLEFEHTRNSCMLGMPQESWVERTLVETQVKLEIQVVPKVLVVVGNYEVPKQPFHQLEFYRDDPVLVVVVDPLSIKENSYSVSKI